MAGPLRPTADGTRRIAIWQAAHHSRIGTHRPTVSIVRSGAVAPAAAHTPAWAPNAGRAVAGFCAAQSGMRSLSPIQITEFPKFLRNVRAGRRHYGPARRRGADPSAVRWRGDPGIEPGRRGSPRPRPRPSPARGHRRSCRRSTGRPYVMPVIAAAPEMARRAQPLASGAATRTARLARSDVLGRRPHRAEADDQASINPFRIMLSAAATIASVGSRGVQSSRLLAFRLDVFFA